MDNSQSTAIRTAALPHEAARAPHGRPQRGRRPLAGIVVAIAATLAVVLAFEVGTKASAIVGYTDGLGVAELHPLEADPIDPSWILSGTPTFRTAVFERSETWGTSSGIWECTGPGSFVWHYTVDEVIYILEGSAEIDYMGRKFTLKAGESTTFVAGTSATWVVNDRIRKTFRIQKPGRLVKAARMLAGYVGL